jgi:hypothetical protein
LQLLAGVDVVVSADATAHGHAPNLQRLARHSFKNFERQKRSYMLPKPLALFTTNAILRHNTIAKVTRDNRLMA